METKKIIEKVRTKGQGKIFCFEKSNGWLRIWLDPRDLNQASKKRNYPTPTLKDITPELTGSKMFCKLEAKNGYWNGKESTLLAKFNTPFIRYKFLRLPFGLKNSQDIIQKKIDETYRKCWGAMGITDDIQIYHKDKADHDLHLNEAM